MESYRKQNLLLREGLVVWAALVQANELLFRPGPMDHPAMVVYVPDESLDSCPEWLESLARDLYRLKNTTPEDPDEPTGRDDYRGDGARAWVGCPRQHYRGKARSVQLR